MAPSGAVRCSTASAGGDVLSFDGGPASIVTLNGVSLVPGPGGPGDPICDPLPAPDGSLYSGSGLGLSTIQLDTDPLDLQAPTRVSVGSYLTLQVDAPPVLGPVLLGISTTSQVGLVESFGMTSFVGQPLQLIALPLAGGSAYQLSVQPGALPPGVPFRNFILQGIQIGGSLRLTAPVAATVE